MKNRLFQIDLGVQLLCLLFFFVVLLSGQNSLYYCFLFAQLLLGCWQLLSAAFWGLVFADYRRGQFLLLGIFALAGVGILLSLPEFRDSELIVLLARFVAVCLLGIYLQLTYRDASRTWMGNAIA